jgi:cytochrome c-type protein NapB
MNMILRCCALSSLIAALALPVIVCADEPDTYEKDAEFAESTPPMIPHTFTDTANGEYCLGCHMSGLNGAPFCPHPIRLNCTGCHGQGEIKGQKSETKGSKSK